MVGYINVGYINGRLGYINGRLYLYYTDSIVTSYM